MAEIISKVVGIKMMGLLLKMMMGESRTNTIMAPRDVPNQRLTRFIEWSKYLSRIRRIRLNSLYSCTL